MVGGVGTEVVDNKGSTGEMAGDRTCSLGGDFAGDELARPATSRRMTIRSSASVVILPRTAIGTSVYAGRLIAGYPGTGSRAAVLCGEVPSVVRLTLAKRNDSASNQEASESGLLWRPADLGDYRRWNQRNDAKLQTSLVFSPCGPLVSVGRHEDGGVVDNGAHAGRRTDRDVRSCARTRWRASFISSALKRPCCFSHRATAAKPARRCNASRAATAIQAETLTPSRAAAARMFL